MPKCNALHNQLYTDIRSYYEPCCKFDISTSPKYHINEYSFNEYKNTEFFKDLVSKMETGWHKGCYQCEDDENHGIDSLRNFFNRTFSGNDSLECLELSISNECNLTCKMCNNIYSSKWASVHEKHPIAELKFGDNFSKYSKVDIKKLYEGLDLSNLTRVKYLGGEPFITPEIYELIEFLEEKNLCQQITFKTNTNTTYFPKKSINTLKKFKAIELGLSIDGVDDLCNFIRTGSDWNKVLVVIEEWLNIRKEFPNFKMYHHHTTQAYNLHQFDTMKRFAESKNLPFHYSVLHEPEYLSYSALPKEYINELVDSKQLTDEKVISSALSTTFNEEYFEQLKLITRKTDAQLNTDIESVVPGLAKYLK